MNKTHENSIDTSELNNLVSQAFEAVAPLWPLETFVAVNHLAGFDKYPFEMVMSRLAPLYGARGFLERQSFEKLRRQGRIKAVDEKEAVDRLNRKAALKSGITLPRVLRSISEQAEKAGKSRKDGVVQPGPSSIDQVKLLNDQTIKWCAPYFDKGNSIWEMPHKAEGLYRAWRELARHDLSLPPQMRMTIANLPRSAEEALEKYLVKTNLSNSSDKVAYLTRLLMLLPGWSSYVRRHHDEPDASSKNIMVDFLAVRAVLDYELNRDFAEIARSSGRQPIVDQIDLDILEESNNGQAAESELPVLQEALEINYRNELIASIKRKLDTDKEKEQEIKAVAVRSANETHRPEPGTGSKLGRRDAQLVFCIDVRSEGMRRHIEQTGNYQTIGFAGFFGFPISLECSGHSEARSLCPVLIKPQSVVRQAAPRDKDIPVLIADRLKSSFREILYTLRSNFLAKFYFAEAAGIWLVPVIFFKSFMPKYWRTISKLLGQTQKNFTLNIEVDPSAISLASRVNMARGALKAMGLREHFSPLVALCGHTASSTNNPYAYSLDCGACGGNGGAVNARTAAAVLNQADVRAELAGSDIIIPADTYFVAAEHNTTLDEIVFFNTEFLPGHHRKLLDTLKADIKKAGERLRRERQGSLSRNNAPKPLDAVIRSVDWSQTRPEWGLARNAAFIAAGRHLTRDVDLQRRTFLHDYDPSKDPDCSILELIMTAPLIVAHWINMQYYLSTVDNSVFGSGSKTTQNIVGNLGVIQGASSDLKLGLPMESVASAEDNIYHEPMRLLVLIESNRRKLEEVMDRHENVLNLVKNSWIRLVALENEQFYEKTETGWELLQVEMGRQSDLIATGGIH